MNDFSFHTVSPSLQSNLSDPDQLYVIAIKVITTTNIIGGETEREGERERGREKG